MSSADVTITALRSGHDSLASLISGLSDDDLAVPSGASEWDISQVLSHLGAVAEIATMAFQAAIDGKPGPESESFTAIWGKWHAMQRRERADGFLRTNGTLTELLESLPATVREELRINLGFLPAPVDVATAGQLWLNELTLHSWDVRVTLDPAAVLADDATAVLMAGVGDLAGRLGKPASLAGRQEVIDVTTSEPARRLTLRLGERISIDAGAPAEPSGTLTLPAEALLRLITGRLEPKHTPAGVTATGAADLDLLRQVFPGF